MPTDLLLRCSCGVLSGVARGLSPRRVNRLICYCDDCQSFAHFLGRADRVLDAHGGTEIFQTSPARIEISAGADRLACMRLTPRGLLRWYAGCCKTPIGNTISGRAPFVGMIHSFAEPVPAGSPADASIGPVRAGVQARFARGERSELDAYDKAPAGAVLRFAFLLLMARLRGDQARSPFFDPRTHEPVALPQVLTPDELREVEASRDASSRVAYGA